MWVYMSLFLWMSLVFIIHHSALLFTFVSIISSIMQRDWEVFSREFYVSKILPKTNKQKQRKKQTKTKLNKTKKYTLTFSSSLFGSSN